MSSDLTKRDMETLNELRACHDSRCPMAWARPLDIGGSSGSHHSGTLKKLERHGFVQSKQRGWPDPVPGEREPKWAKGSRGAKVYRITPAGRTALALFQGSSGQDLVNAGGREG